MATPKRRQLRTPQAIHGVVMTGGPFAGLLFLIAAGLLVIYPLNREENKKIAVELSERRKKFVS